MQLDLYLAGNQLLEISFFYVSTALQCNTEYFRCNN